MEKKKKNPNDDSKFTEKRRVDSKVVSDDDYSSS